MKLGVFTPVFGDRTLDQVLKKMRSLPGVSAIELATVGWGHDTLVWKEIVSALRMVGYDYVISIEHEDALASVDEGLESAARFLSDIVLKEPPTEPWWT